MEGAPPLVEILKALGKHRRQLWEQTYGKIDRADKQEALFLEALRLFGQNKSNLAAAELVKFVVAGDGQSLCLEEQGEIKRHVAAAVRAKLVAERKGRDDWRTPITDFGPIVAKAHRQYAKIRQYQIAEKDYDAYFNHLLLEVCAWVEENAGIPREKVEWAAHRLNTVIGLREWTPQTREPWPDYLWMVEKFNALDSHGQTGRLWGKLRQEHSSLLEDIGLLQRCGSRRGEARTTQANNRQASAGGITRSDNHLTEVPPLSERQYLILQALVEMGATSAERRRSTVDVARKAEGQGVDPAGFKEPVADLKRRTLINTKEGRAGGCWISSDGVKVFEMIQANRAKL